MRFEFRALGDFFSTRERGTKIRAQIEEALRGIPEDEPLLLDFEGVQLISFSFADEVVGRLVQGRAAGELGERPLLVLHAEDEVLHPIESSMVRRKLIAACDDVHGIRLVGAAKHLQATFDAARARGEFTTHDLADALGIGVPALNNRLKPLIAAGVLTRQPSIPQTGGREYSYRVVLPSPETVAR
jgi:hypothetical protein